METITKFRAYNGAEFNAEEKCRIYESNCRKADAIVSKLPERPDDLDFSNGHGFIQHDPEIFKKVRRKLLEQANDECEHKWFTQSIEDESCHPSWAHRIISEACTKNLNDAWYRILCTDFEFREWGQPYYAANPNQAHEHKKLN